MGMDTSGEPLFSLSEFTEELAVAFGATAIRNALDLMLTAHDRGLAHQEGVLTSAAIMLCGSKYRPAIRL